MKEHKLTWHEKQDGKTMKKVPTLLHQNLDHSGGISMESSRTNEQRIGNYKDYGTDELLANPPQQSPADGVNGSWNNINESVLGSGN